MNNLIKKGVVVAVILLFIGLAFAPSINANISKISVDDELVEFTTEVCEIDGVKPYTVKLTTEEANEVDRLFDNIRVRLNESKSREETVEIFNEAVVELDNYGLLGELSIKQAQRLVTGRYKFPIDNRVFKLIQKIIIIKSDENENFNCQITGKTRRTRVVGSMMTFLSIELAKFFLIPFSLLAVLFASLARISPVNYLSAIDYGYSILVGTYQNNIPASGWVYTDGLNGIITWNKSFYGQYGRFVAILPDQWWYRGTKGFTGFNLFYDLENWYVLGNARSVKIGPNPPDL